MLASDLALIHYDPAKKSIVAADASSYGIGAVLMHECEDGIERPVIYAALSFTKAEKNYLQVQREALALKFAVQKFHRYIYGRTFELRTDHKPLLVIFGSKTGIPVHTASLLQRYALARLRFHDKVREHRKFYIRGFPVQINQQPREARREYRHCSNPNGRRNRRMFRH